jgi:hypothetical protein
MPPSRMWVSLALPMHLFRQLFLQSGHGLRSWTGDGLYPPKSPIPSANACFPPIPQAVRPAHVPIAHASARHYPRASASQLCDVIPLSVSPRPPQSDGLDAEMAIHPEIMEIHTLLAIETTNYQCPPIPSRFLTNHDRFPSNMVVETRSFTWWCICPQQ